MKIVVTGATGFVGQHLTSRLKDLGHDVFVLVRNPKKLEDQFSLDHIIEIDLKSANAQEIKSKLPREIDCVIHTAGIVHSFNEQDFYDVNTTATLNLYQSLSEEVHFIFLSSLAASGPSQKNKDLTEDDDALPVSDYGRSKLKAEKQLLEISQNTESSNAKISILRPPMVVGPGDQGVLEIIKMIQSGLVITTGQGGMSKRYSYVSVYDLVQACLILMESPPQQSQLFFCSYPQTLKLKELVKKVQKELEVKKVRQIQLPQAILSVLAKTFKLAYQLRPHSIRLTPDKLNELIPESWTCSGQKLCQNNGFVYRDSLEKILPITIKDYKKRGWL